MRSDEHLYAISRTTTLLNLYNRKSSSPLGGDRGMMGDPEVDAFPDSDDDRGRPNWETESILVVAVVATSAPLRSGCIALRNSCSTKCLKWVKVSK